MPIKVQCTECQTNLSVSDQAAGKAVKCRQCGARVKVPGAAAAASAAGSVPAKRRAPGKAQDPDDLFGDINLNQLEDTKKKVCPGCANPVKDEDIECPKCGVNIGTGVLSDRQRIKRERKGPPPEEFYRDVWSNAWKFFKKHWTYAVRTALIWSMCVSMALTCAYALNFYVTKRQASLEEMVQKERANITIIGDRLFIKVPEGKGNKVEFDGKFYQRDASIWAPHVQPWTEPPSMFWIFMTGAFSLGFGGWFWTMATTITNTTMAGEKRVKRFNFDFFANLTLGIRFFAWPTVLMLPFLLVAGGVAALNPLVGGILAAVFMIFPVLVLPAAVVHMAQKFSYRAWLLFWMTRDFGRSIGASLYVFMMMLFLVLLIPGGVAGAAAATSGRLVPWLQSQELAATDWLSANVMALEAGGNMRFLMFQMPLVFSSSFAFFCVLFGLISCQVVFMMRVIGLYGLYFRADLSIVNEFPDFERATFGPRYLAFLVDLIIMALLAGVGMFIGQMFGFLFSMYGWSFAAQGALIAGGVASLILWGMYFTLGESGSARATLGKWSIGIVVMQDDGLPIPMPMSRDLALKRAASAFLSVLTLFIGFLSCVWREDRKAMHDAMTKTKVVWQPETT